MFVRINVEAGGLFYVQEAGVRQLKVLANSDQFLTGLTLTTNNFALDKATGSCNLSTKSSNFFFFLDLEI